MRITPSEKTLTRLRDRQRLQPEEIKLVLADFFQKDPAMAQGYFERWRRGERRSGRLSLLNDLNRLKQSKDSELKSLPLSDGGPSVTGLILVSQVQALELLIRRL